MADFIYSIPYARYYTSTPMLSPYDLQRFQDPIEHAFKQVSKSLEALNAIIDDLEARVSALEAAP